MSLYINKQNESNLNFQTSATHFSSNEEASTDLHLVLKSFASTLNIIINNEANQLGIKLYDLQVEVVVNKKKGATAFTANELGNSIEEAEVKLHILTKATLESIAFLFKYVRKKCPILATLGENIPISYHIEQQRFVAA